MPICFAQSAGFWYAVCAKFYFLAFCRSFYKNFTLYLYIIERKYIQMKKYVCKVCQYVYDPQKGDPDSGIAAGTSFEDLPDDWVCPVCGVGKDEFEEAQE